MLEMRKLIYFTMMSLDGYIARPNGDLDWQTMDEELHKFVNAQQREFGAYLHGRRIYEMMAAAWPPLETDPSAPDYMAEFSRIWKTTPKIVFSKTLDHVEWNSRLVRDNVAEEVKRLKAEPGGDLEVGGADLAGTLIQLGLVDEYRLYFSPVVLGTGIRPFRAEQETIKLKLMETQTFKSGVVYLRYERANEG